MQWSATSGELALVVRKEVGPEVGLLRFVGVCHVNLAPRMTIAGIERSDQGGPVSGAAKVGPGESLYVFEESWGAAYFVIAESVSYEVQAAAVAGDRGS